MKLTHLLLILTSLAIAADSNAVIVNLDSAQWSHEKGDPPGSEGVMLRMDKATGGMELLVRFPPGHVIAPHFHESNERIIVVEGQLTLRQDSGVKEINAGGFAYLPAREVQRLSCSSKTRCTFYLAWDGKPTSHKVK
jgi:quercetin dioxygenase-like cupin family protein